MVVLVTDNDIYYELRTPGITSIGRGSSNDVVPESRSISKSHASLTLQMTTYSKLEMWIEDLNSTNGTYLGPSPLDIHKISGKEKVAFGDYLRFGHSSQFFRVMESMIPGTGILSEPPQDVSSEESVQNNFDGSDEHNESLMYRDVDQEYGNEYQNELGDSLDRDESEDSLRDNELVSHPELPAYSRLSRSTPVPYIIEEEDDRNVPAYQRRSAEYPRGFAKEQRGGGGGGGKQAYRSEPPSVSVNYRKQERTPERGSESNRAAQSYNINNVPQNSENMKISIPFPSTINSIQPPVSGTMNPRNSGIIGHEWESPFSPDGDDNEESGSQIFPESSQENSPSPLLFRSDYYYGNNTNNLAMSGFNNQSINRSASFSKNNTKNLNHSNFNYSNDTNDIFSKLESTEDRPRSQMMAKPDINLPRINNKEKESVSQNKNNDEKNETNLTEKSAKNERKKSVEKISKSYEENSYADENEDLYNSSLIEIPNIKTNNSRLSRDGKNIGNKPKKEFNGSQKDFSELQNPQKKIRNDSLSAVKNARDNESQEWGFGLNFSHQNQSLSLKNKAENSQNNKLSGTKVIPLLFNSTKTISDRKKGTNQSIRTKELNSNNDTSTSSMTRGTTKNEKTNYGNIFPLSKIDPNREGLDSNNFSVLLDDDNLREQLTSILGPKIPNLHGVVGNNKGKSLFTLFTYFSFL